MRSLPWSRSETIKGLREDIWRYISAQAEPQEQLLQASALLQLNPTDVAVLAGVHFLESDPVQNLLDKRQYLSRHMATSSVDEEELSHAQIRGPIVWPRTYGARTAHGWSSNLYVTSLSAVHFKPLRMSCSGTSCHRSTPHLPVSGDI